MGDGVAVGHGVKGVFQPDLAKDDGRVFAGGADGHLHAPLLEIAQRIQRAGQNVRTGQASNQLHIICILARGHGLLFIVGIGPLGALKDDFQAFHAADAAQALVDGAVKIDAFLVGHALPGQIVAVVGRYDDAVQIEDDAEDVAYHMRSFLS